MNSPLRRPSATTRPPLFLSLEPVLRCPNRRCGRVAFGIASDLFTFTCPKCGAHWWANRFSAGSIRDQIRDQFDGDEHFVYILDALGAPEYIERPMFWQIWLTGNEQYQFTNNPSNISLLERTRSFIQKMASLHRAAL